MPSPKYVVCYLNPLMEKSKTVTETNDRHAAIEAFEQTIAWTIHNFERSEYGTYVWFYERSTSGMLEQIMRFEGADFCD